MKYIVMCYRSASSRLGAAQAPMKHHGDIVYFDTFDKAEAAADNWNAAAGSSNVSYKAMSEGDAS